MSSFFSLISSSFGTNNSQKKLLIQILHSKYQLQVRHEPLELKKILTDPSTQQLFIRQLSTPSSHSKLPSYHSKPPPSKLNLPPSNSKSPSLHSKLPSTKLNHSLLQTYNSILTLKKLSLLHHLTIYYAEFSHLIDKIDFDGLMKRIPINDWMLVNVLKPYACFIKKYCLSIQVYQKLRLMPYGNKHDIFESLCYAVNLFKPLFAVVSKLSSMGRYFLPLHCKQMQYFVQLIAYHSQLIYQSFKNCIAEIVSFSQQHISMPQYETIFKHILQVDLVQINQEMKRLFLDKYFYPYGKGYGVKLYLLEDQNQNHLKLINAIISDHQQTERQNQLQMFQDILFPNQTINSQQLEASFTLTIEKLSTLNYKNTNSNVNNININTLKKRNTLNVLNASTEHVYHKTKHYQSKNSFINIHTDLHFQKDQFVNCTLTDNIYTLQSLICLNNKQSQENHNHNQYRSEQNKDIVLGMKGSFEEELIEEV